MKVGTEVEKKKGGEKYKNKIYLKKKMLGFKKTFTKQQKNI